MGDISQLLEAAKGIASSEIPTGGGGGEGASIILQIMQANAGKYFTGKALKKLFEEESIDIKQPSNILFALRKAGKIEKVQNGVYVFNA